MDRLDEILRPYKPPPASQGEAPKRPPPPPPLFLYLAEQAVHIPIQSPPEEGFSDQCRGVTGGQTLTNRTTLCAMAGSLDASLGRVSSLLHQYDMWEDTLVSE